MNGFAKKKIGFVNSNFISNLQLSPNNSYFSFKFLKSVVINPKKNKSKLVITTFEKNKSVVIAL